LDNNIINNRYEILEEIGSGGMAIIYKAHDIRLDRIVAIKILRDNLIDSQEFIVRFKKEAQSAARLSHINITAIYDIDFTDNLNYIVMEYIDGISLKKFIDDQKKISWEESLNILIQTSKALENAHRNNIIHRDIKPDNILINEDGVIKVSDFGIAKLLSSATEITQKGVIMGSLYYMSPEQIRGKKLDIRTDIYSLGVTFYEMVTGELPFLGTNIMSIANKHMSDNPIPPLEKINNLPPIINNIILKSLKKDPNERYSSISDFLIDLNKALRTSNQFRETVFLHNKIYDTSEKKTQEILNYNTGNKPSNAPKKFIYFFMAFCLVIMSLLIIFKFNSLFPAGPNYSSLNTPKTNKSTATKLPENLSFKKNTEDINKIMEDGFENYYISLVNAINENDFSLVAPTLVENSSLYYSQKELVDKLSKQNIKEKLISFDIKDMESVKNSQYKVSVEEIIGIKKLSANYYVNNTFKYTYWVQENNGEIQLSDIQKWVD
jgi:serine/threonine protein kinase